MKRFILLVALSTIGAFVASIFLVVIQVPLYDWLGLNPVSNENLYRYNFGYCSGAAMGWYLTTTK